MPRCLRLSASDSPQMPPPTMATFMPSSPVCRPRVSEFFDLHLAELDRALAVLQGDRTLVEHIGFVAGPVGDFLGVEAAEIDAAIGIMARPELNPHNEVLVRFRADQI